ncbi:MAG: S8 family serine peptidase [Anaerolineales bacterium]|nr:S8 family serine peptidase [Anaerolineales bacterium]
MKFYRLLNLGVIFALVVTMMFPASLVAYAGDGGTVDPPPAEEATVEEAPVADETSGDVELVEAEAEESPSAEAEAVVEEETPVAEEAEPAEDEEVAPAETEEIVEEAPVVDESQTVEAEAEDTAPAEADEATALAEADDEVALAEAESASSPIVVMDTEGVIVGVVNEDGEALALVSTEAAEILENAEPLTDAVAEVLDAPDAQLLAAPTDPHYISGDQYGIDAIQLPAAWDIATGTSVIVAVLDSGIDLDHPDLIANLIAGYNAINPLTLPQDEVDSHGTHVAGVIGAVTNNGIGIAGSAPAVSIMPVKVCDATGCEWDWVSAGIIWAVDNGADIINMSLGGVSVAPDPGLVAAVDYAYNNGVTLVAAAGNCDDGDDDGECDSWWVNYPALLPNVISVAAVDDTNTTADFSSFWTDPTVDPVKPEGHMGVDISAPGVGIWSTVWDNDYAGVNWDGTSMATPFVSGVAALLASLPQFDTPAKIREALLSTARDLGPAGWDEDYGFGLVQAYDALLYVPPVIPPDPIVPPAPVVEEGGDEDGTISIFGNGVMTLTQDADGALHFYYKTASGNVPIGALALSEWSGASSGTVLINLSYPDLGILLRVTALGDGHFLVQIYSLVDGSLLSDVVITL